MIVVMIVINFTPKSEVLSLRLLPPPPTPLNKKHIFTIYLTKNKHLRFFLFIFV